MTERNSLEKNWTPFLGWARSLPLALGIPVACWVVLFGVGSIMEYEAFFAGMAFLYIVLCFAIPIHLLMYAAVGLPMFFFGRTAAGRWIWILPIALLLGVVAGVIPALLVAIPIYGAEDIYNVEPAIVVMLGVYGLATGFAAYRQRPAGSTTN